MALGVAPAVHAAGNVIVANGRTATHILVHGDVTDIGTSTIRGSTAFNAFSHFREASGKIVNLKIPRQASTLLNMVYGGQTVIDGVLNGYHDGHIGGDVVFADPEGLLVGAHGVVNVGALTVTTPTPAFMNQVLSADGNVNLSATQQLLTGRAPQSADGVIRVLGQINAVDGISLQAASVLEAASGHMTAGDAAYTRMKLFEDTVNTRGLQQGTQAVADDGVITIEGAQTAQVAGAVQAAGADHGGGIGISAPQVTLAEGARLDVSGAQGGGEISIGGGPHALTQQSMAQTVTVEQGATLAANATRRGDGGHVVVWSQLGTDFGGHISARGGAQGGNGGEAEVSSPTGLDFHGTVDTRAPQGENGDLLLDPNNLDIVGTGSTTATSSTDTSTSTGVTTTYGGFNQTPSTSYVTVSTLKGLGDTNITLQAFNKITVGDSLTNTSADANLTNLTAGTTLTLEAGATTSTGLSSGTTGAGDIVFESGSQIKTGGGNVVLDAGAAFSGAAATDGTATLGSITTDGGAITVNAGGGILLGPQVTLDSEGSSGTTIGAGKITLRAVQAAANGGGLLDLSTVYQSVSPVIVSSAKPSATATIDIYGTIEGGDVSLSASAQAASSFAANPQEQSVAESIFQHLGLPTGPTDPLLQAYHYASSANAQVIVHHGAQITGNNVSLVSDAQPTISLGDGNAVPTGEYFTAMAAELNGTSTAQINTGATVSAADGLNVNATAEPSMDVTVADAVSNTSVAPSVTLAYGKATIRTTAQIETGAIINMTNAGNVEIDAANNQSFALKASAAPTTTGASKVNVGIAAVIGNYSTQAIANEGASLSNVGDVTVNAVSNTDKNETSADTSATAGGQPLDQGSIDNSKQSGALQSLFGRLLAAIRGKAHAVEASDNSLPSSNSSGGGSGFGLGSAVTLNFSDLNAQASVEKTSNQTASGYPDPTICADGNGCASGNGNLTVHAVTSDPGFHNLANSEVASTEPSQTNSGGSSKVGLSLAVSLGWETGGAKAFIGNGVTVNAIHVAVGAKNSTPLAFLQPFNDLLTVADELYTQYREGQENGFGATTLLSFWSELAPAEKKAVRQVIADFKTFGTDASTLRKVMGNSSDFLAQLTNIVSNDAPALLNDYNALPHSITDVWKQSKVGSIIGEIKAFVTSPEGMSSFARALATAGKAGIAGAVDYLSLGSNAQALIAPGASITLATPSGSSGMWSTTIETDHPNDITDNDTDITDRDNDAGTNEKNNDINLQWGEPLTVQAVDSTYALNGAGNGFLKQIGAKSSGGSNSVGVGGAFLWVDASNSAQAWIANGAAITTNGNSVAIKADNLQRFASFVPSAGAGSGYAGNGAAAVTRVAGTIEAAIGNRATVDAGGGQVALNAANSLDVLSVAGALAKAQKDSVGVGVALNFVDPSTTAGMLDTSALTNSAGTAAATGRQDCTATYCLKAGALDVEARTQGASIALGVAGAKSGGSGSSSSGTGTGTGSSGGNTKDLLNTIKDAATVYKDDQKSKNQGKNQSVSGGLNQTESSANNNQGQLQAANTDSQATAPNDKKKGSGASSSTMDTLKKTYHKAKLANDINKLEGSKHPGNPPKQPKMSLTIAGSVAANFNQSHTTASLLAATISLSGSGGATVRAADDSLDLALAGAGALLGSGPRKSSSSSVAIAGTLALNVLGHQTTASITKNSALTLTDSGADVNVQALSGGDAVSAGLGMAYSGSDKALASVVGSGSVTIDRNGIQATLNDATLKLKDATPDGNGVSVQALNAVNIGTGGGALMISKGGEAGIGMAVSVAMLKGQTTASMYGGSVSGFSGMAVQAFSPGWIGSAAAVASLGGSSKLTLAGSVVVNEIADTTGACIGQKATVTLSKGLTVEASSQRSPSLENQLNASTQTLAYDFKGVGLDAFGINPSNGATAPTLGGQSDTNQQSPGFTAASSTPSSSKPGASIIGVAGSFAISKGGAASVGLSAVYNAIANQFSASVGNATLKIGEASGSVPPGSVDITATNATRLIGVAAGTSVATGKLSALGSFSINNLEGNVTQALLGDTASPSDTTVNGDGGAAPSVDISTTDSGAVWSGAGGVSAGGKVGVGAALALNLTGQQVTAEVSHTNVTASQLMVKAASLSHIDSLAVAVAAASTAAFGGSLNLTIDTGSTNALVKYSKLTMSGDLQDNATDSSKVWDGAGAVGASSSGGVGVGVAVNVTARQINATLSSDSLLAAGHAVGVDASDTGFIAAGGVGAAGGSDFGGGLGVVANVASDQVSADIKGVNGGTTDTSASFDSLDVNATDSSQVYALGGALAGSGSAALGGAVVVNWVGQQITAGLSGDNLDGTRVVDVAASNKNARIGALAAAVAGSGDATFVGAVTTNFISGSTTASDTNSIVSGGALTLDAEDGSAIDAIGIGASGSGAAAFGAGVALNSLSGTTQAYIDGGSVGAKSQALQNVTVEANSNRTIKALAAGAGVGGVFGAAGGVVTELLNGITQACIDDGAQVVAIDNVAVLASDVNTLKAATGNLAFGSFGGLGLSVSVNVLNDTTRAYIGQGSGKTKVTARGQGNSVRVDSGQLASLPNVGSSISSTSYTPPTLSDSKATLHGVVVNAQSRNVEGGLAAGLSLGVNPDTLVSLALEVDTSTNVLGGDTEAYVDGAGINTLSDRTPNADQAVSIVAGRHDFATGLATGAAAGTGASATGAVVANSFDATTKAYVQGGTVDAQGVVNVDAYATQDSRALAAGLAAGLAGGTGSGIINLCQATTQADVQGATINAGGLDIEAHNNTGVNLIGGSLSIGGGAVGASFLVNVGQDSTQAWLGDSTGNATTTTTLDGGDLTVEADSNSQLSLASVTASLGGLAVAGAVNAIVLNSTTEANVYDATVTNADNAAVQAGDTTTVSGSYAGGLAAGGVGAGVAVNLLIVRNTVAAGIDNSTLGTTRNPVGAVTVDADSTKYVNLFTLAGSVGGMAGIGGAVSLILTGSSSSQYVNDVQDALNKLNANGDSISGALNALSGTNTTQNDASLSSGSSGQQAEFGGESSYTPGNGNGVIATRGTTPDATTATVQGGSICSASVAVSATDTTATQNVAGGVGAAGAVGIGAGIAVTSGNDDVGATLMGALVTAPTVSIGAAAKNGAERVNGFTLNKAVDVQAYDGAAGLSASLGAAVAAGAIDNIVNAQLEPATGSTLSDVTIAAKDGESVQTTAAGANLSTGLTKGAAIGVATRSSNVTAGFTGAAERYQNVTLTADGSGRVDSNVTAVAAGIISGSAATATAIDNSTVNAMVGSNSTFAFGPDGGMLHVEADLTPTVSATATGVNVGVRGVGASVATAQEGSDGSAAATVGNNVTVGGSGALYIQANASPTISSYATAGTGSLIGSQSVTSTASNAVHVEASTGTGLILPGGNVTLNATQAGSVSAAGTGVLAGVLAAGAVIVGAEATPIISAELGAGMRSSANRSGDLTISSIGSDTVSAKSTSGAGGGGVSNAAKATTRLNATTIARTNDTLGTVYAGMFTLSAKHSATVTTQANSTNVSLARGGAASAHSTVDSTVYTIYGSGTDITANAGIILAENTVVFPNAVWNADGSAGGGANSNSISAQALLGLATNVEIGSGALTINPPNPVQSIDYPLTISAYNDVSGNLSARLASGGIAERLNSAASIGSDTYTSDACAIGATQSCRYRGLSANVKIDHGAEINATGNIAITSGSSGNLVTKAVADASGGASVLSSSAVTTLSAEQNIELDGTVESTTNIWLGAGDQPSRVVDQLSLTANSRSNNYTVLAVGTHPSASASLGNSNSVNITGSVLAAGNITIDAVRGHHSASASAIGQTSYDRIILKVVSFARHFGLFSRFVRWIRKVFHVTVQLNFGYHGGSAVDDSTSSVTIGKGATVEADKPLPPPSQGNDCTSMGGSCSTVTVSQGFVHLGNLTAENITLNQLQSKARFDGYIVGRLILVTPETRLVVDNMNPTVRNVDFQLYQPGSAFSFVLNGKHLFTDAYVEHYAPGYVVTVSDYWAPHLPTAIDYTSGSSERSAGELIENDLRTGSLPLPNGMGAGIKQPALMSSYDGLKYEVNMNFSARPTHHHARAR